jgi:predicted esterase
MSLRTKWLLAPALAAMVLPAGGAGGVVPDPAPELPVLGAGVRAGTGLAYTPGTQVAPSAKTVDGEIDDWTGSSTRLAGTAVYSRGEFVYQDYYYDGYGADDGQDAARLAVTDEVRDLEPRTSRLEALAQALGDEFGAPGPETISAEVHYGDAEYPGAKHVADIEEVRLAADPSTVFVLVRTTNMIGASQTAVLLLFDTVDGAAMPAIGFGAGVSSSAADVAVFASGSSAAVEGGSGSGVAAATQPAGYTNAIEISLPRALVERADGRLRVAAATGLKDPTGMSFLPVAQGEATANLFNAAFRYGEPVSLTMEKLQAMTLLAGSIDPFTADVSLARLTGGSDDSFQIRPGYYERTFESSTQISSESGEQGIFQHYGIYVPTAYREGSPSPLTFWLHFRGGRTHSAAAWLPRVIRQLGEDRGNLIVSPSARGSSTWYLGRAHADFLEVWDDAVASVDVDRDRIYVSGYSMGGYGSYLMGLLYPDRFAAAFPTVGPTLCGLWAYPAPPQGGAECTPAVRTWTFPILDNAANLPFVIFEGSDDELVPVTGSYAVGNRMIELGYRYRFYDFLGYEHYSNAIVDEWAEGGRYLDQFRRDPSPARVVYKRVPALERAVERMPRAEDAAAGLSFDFDHAYWASHLTLRTGAESDDPAVFGMIDATTSARGGRDHLGPPEAGAVAPGHSTPFLMTGLRWLEGEPVAPANRFTATLTNLSLARLDGPRMGLDTTSPIVATVVTDGPATLEIAGSWEAPVPVTGTGVTTSYDGAIVSIELPAAGTYQISIGP